MTLHYILVVLIIIVIIGAQLYIYKNTKNKISTYKSIFPASSSSYSVINMDIETTEDDSNSEYKGVVTVSQVQIDTQNPTLIEIRNALNTYLQKNKGAASDFYLMKDVVERYCDADEEEISIQQPIPLYLVMMPKVVGVVLDQMTRIVRFWSFAFLNNSIIAVQEKIPLYKVLKMLFRESAMDS